MRVGCVDDLHTCCGSANMVVDLSGEGDNVANVVHTSYPDTAREMSVRPLAAVARQRVDHRQITP
jgi:hypothetical protein